MISIWTEPCSVQSCPGTYAGFSYFGEIYREENTFVFASCFRFLFACTLTCCPPSNAILTCPAFCTITGCEYLSRIWNIAVRPGFLFCQFIWKLTFWFASVIGLRYLSGNLWLLEG